MPPRAVATQSMATKRAKNRSEDPRSFSASMTTSDTAHARRMGPRCLRLSWGSINPKKRRVCERSACLSTRYDAKNTARTILASSPGWKLAPATRTQMRLPLMFCPMPGTSGSMSSATPRSASV